MIRLLIIGGSDAGISAALRARELDPTCEVTVVVADAYPNFSICGLPYYLSGEVADWHNLAHRTIGELEETGIQLRLDTLAHHIDVEQRTLLVTDRDGQQEVLSYDELVIGTGALPIRPSIDGLTGPDPLGAADGVHLLPARTPSAGHANSQAVSAPKSSRFSTTRSPGQVSATTKPRLLASTRSPWPPKRPITRPTTRAPTRSRSATPATAQPADC
jgi:NADPH-dependent 2,4-dienoyl-CoA reductase/sulfur reductase-like enzyme